MVLSIEEKKARRAESNREYYQKKKEQISEKQKAWREKNKEHRAKIMKAYQQSPAGKKSQTIIQWKRYGLIHDDYDALYQQYLEATHCNACKSEFKDSFDRKMDHNHTNGQFRQFLCGACNGFDRWLKHQTSS